MKKIRTRSKFLRINSPVSFGILCALIILLIGGVAYGLAAGVVAPAIKSVQAEAVTPTPEPTDTPAPATATPEPTQDVESIESGVMTTIDPVTGEMVLVDPDATATPEPLPLTGVTVAIDAAKSSEGKHKGVASGTYEYKINLAFAQEVEDQLVELGATVVMTRESNNDAPSAEARVKKVNESEAVLLISIFCNDLSNATTRGAEAFVANKSSSESKALAKTILNAYIKSTGMPLRYPENDSVRKTTDRKVLSDTKVPAMGLVIGQLSNRSDDANLNDPVFVKKAAEGIVNGIREYLGK